MRNTRTPKRSRKKDTKKSLRIAPATDSPKALPKVLPNDTQQKSNLEDINIQADKVDEKEGTPKTLQEAENLRNQFASALDLRNPQKIQETDDRSMASSIAKEFLKNESIFSKMKRYIIGDFCPYISVTLASTRHAYVDGKKKLLKPKKIFTHQTAFIPNGGKYVIFQSQHKNSIKHLLKEPWRENQIMYLKVICWSKDYLTADDLIGMQKMDVTNAFRQGSSTFNVPLYRPTGTGVVGLVEFKMKHIHQMISLEINAAADLKKPRIKRVSNAYAFRGILAIAFYVSIGLMYYTWIEQWTYSEIFYWIFIALSTVGYGDHNTFIQSYTYLFTALYMMLGFILIGVSVQVIVGYIKDHLNAEQSNFFYDLKVTKTYDVLDDDEVEQQKSKKSGDCLIMAWIYWRKGQAIFWFFATACTLLISTTTMSLVQPPNEEAARPLQYDEAIYFFVTTFSSTGFGDYVPEKGRGIMMVWIIIGTFATIKIGINASNKILDARKRSKRISILRRTFHSRTSFELFDENGDGSISELEFMVKMLFRLKLCANDDVNAIVNAFRKLDPNGDGKVESSEVVEYIKSVREGVLEKNNKLDNKTQEF